MGWGVLEQTAGWKCFILVRVKEGWGRSFLTSSQAKTMSLFSVLADLLRQWTICGQVRMGSGFFFVLSLPQPSEKRD